MRDIASIGMIVMKFGGTSVGNAERIKIAGQLVIERSLQKPIVVVSAVSGVTDLLINSAHKALSKPITTKRIRNLHLKILKDLHLPSDLVEAELKELDTILQGICMIKEVSAKTLDVIQSFGERMSAKIFAAHLSYVGTPAIAYPIYDLGFRTDGNHGEAAPLEESFAHVHKNLRNAKQIPIITGFIGKSTKGEITTLGRGGSDYTAALIGLIMNAKEIQIWTDVDGVLSCDPRLVTGVKNIQQLSFAEASEISFFGAKVLHPKTIWPAVKKNIPVRVLNTHNPKHHGTVIVKKSEKVSKGVKVITFKKNVTLLNVHSLGMFASDGFLAKIFEVFAKYEISIDMLATSEVSVSMTINDTEHLDRAIHELSTFSHTKVGKKRAIICCVGEGIKTSPHVPGILFETLASKGISPEMISQGSSEINIGFVVSMDKLHESVTALHSRFFG